MLDNEINVFKVFGTLAFGRSVIQFGDRNVRNKTVLKAYDNPYLIGLGHRFGRHR